LAQRQQRHLADKNRVQGYPKKHLFFQSKTRWKNPAKNPAPNLIQFQFVMPVTIKDFFMFTASDNQ